MLTGQRGAVEEIKKNITKKNSLFQCGLLFCVFCIVLNV